MSESEEMYLVTIAAQQEAGAEMPLALSTLAQELSVQPVSVHQMIRKLEEAELVSYQPYKGVQLTDKGASLALRVLRNRRLWEVFLVEKLDLPLAEAHEIACRLEHAIPDDAVEQLAAFLGEPSVTPQGQPIPPAGGASLAHKGARLNSLGAGDGGRVAEIAAGGAARAFLEREGLCEGVMVRVLGTGAEGAVLAGVGERTISLDAPVAEAIWIQPAK